MELIIENGNGFNIDNGSLNTIGEKLPIDSNRSDINQHNDQTSLENESTVDFDSVENNETKQVTTHLTKKKRLAIIDSDSENEEAHESVVIPQNEQATYTLGSKGELILETANNSKAKVLNV